MEMIIHPKNNMVVNATDFTMFEDWQQVEFLTATDCEVIEVAGGFKLVGKVNGETFESFLSIDEYFDGKHFIYQIAAKTFNNVIQFPKKIGVTTYTPEMKDAKPLADIEAKMSHTGSKWRLKTRLALKGRGIKLHDADNGINVYYATELAFEKLEQQYAISMECLLD